MCDEIEKNNENENSHFNIRNGIVDWEKKTRIKYIKKSTGSLKFIFLKYSFSSYFCGKRNIWIKMLILKIIANKKKFGNIKKKVKSFVRKT